MTRQGLLLIFSVLISNALLFTFFYWKAIEKVRNWVFNSSLRTLGLISIVYLFVWSIIFLVYKFEVTGDVVYYIRQGKQVLSGLIPIKDFESPYMPGFIFLMGFIYSAFQSIYTIPIFFVLCSLLSAAILLVLYSSNSITGNLSIALGFLNGATWLYTIGYQQDEPLLLLFATVIYAIFLKRGHWLFRVLAGVLSVVAILCTKVMFVFYLLPLVIHFIFSRKKNKPEKMFLISIGLTSVFLLVTLLGSGIPLEKLLTTEIGNIAPPSLLSIVSVIPSIYRLVVGHTLIYYSCIMVGIALIGLKMRKTYIQDGWIEISTLAFLFLLLFSIKSLPTYRLLILPLIPVLLYRKNQFHTLHVGIFLSYTTLLASQAYFYEHWIDTSYWNYLSGENFIPSHFIIIMAVDILIVSAEIYWFYVFLKNDRLHQE